MEKITALHRNHVGDIISFQTSQGRIISYRKAIQEVENGLLEGIELQVDNNGSLLLAPVGSTFDNYPQIY